MATLDSLRVDLEELKFLIPQASRQRTKAIFNVEIEKLQTEIKQLEKNKCKNAEKTDDTKESSNAPGAPKVKVASRVLSSITTYGWDQSEKFMKLYIMMNGVQNIPKENITCSFSKTGLDLRVMDFNNKDHRLYITRLTESILPEPSYFKVKTDMVQVMMKKEEVGKTWAYVTRKEDGKRPTPTPSASKPKPKGGEEGDGMMDMLQQMYDDGDDEMKRTIQKSWHESQNRKTGADMPPSGGGAGGMGGMGGLGGGMGGMGGGMGGLGGGMGGLGGGMGGLGGGMGGMGGGAPGGGAGEMPDMSSLLAGMGGGGGGAGGMPDMSSLLAGMGGGAGGAGGGMPDMASMLSSLGRGKTDEL